MKFKTDLILTPCRTGDELHDWVRVFVGLNIPRAPVCANHDAPFEYLRRAYFEPADDMIVWAPRGGGKTRLAAVATLLDLLHKPGVAVRILGGSLEQSLRMWEHLVPDLERLVPDLLQKQKIQSRRLRLSNGSTCAVLTQSQRAVRGLRVQKLRCDEVELFDPAVWESAQLVTRSKLPLPVLREGDLKASPSGEGRVDSVLAHDDAHRNHSENATHRHGESSDSAPRPLPCPTPRVLGEGVRGTIEALSTHHRPFGLMHELLEAQQLQSTPSIGGRSAESDHRNAGDSLRSRGVSNNSDILPPPCPPPRLLGGEVRRRVIKWCVLDVLQRCAPDRDCRSCPLWEDCGGIAKTKCDGFIPIDDAIALKRRVSTECWSAEMMCQKPSVRGCVFPSFDPAVHVRELWVAGGGLGVGMDASNARTTHPQPATNNTQPTTHLSLDFGFANPFVCLWIRASGRGDGAIVHVIDEYVQAGQTLDVHLRQIQLRQHGPIEWIACDPAGSARSDQTAASNVALLRRGGFRVRYRTSRIVDGLEMIRAALRPAAGAPRLFIHPRCARLQAALRGYRYPDPDSSGASSELP